MNPKVILKSFVLAVSLMLGSIAYAAPPSNDSFANAIQLSGTFASASGTTEDATRQAGESSLSGDFTVWYKWTAPSTGRARFSALGTDNDFESQRITVWTGTSLGNIKLLGVQEEYTREAVLLDLPVAAGTPIYFCVAHRSDNDWDQGAFDCAIVLSTNSDLNSRNVEGYSTSDGQFNNATVLTGNDSTSISYSRDYPQREAGEPQINPNYSSWWKWTAVEDGTVVVSLAGSEIGKYYDHWSQKTFLAYHVDTYSEMINASPIAGNSIGSGLPGAFSFPVTAGETYYIAAGAGQLTQYGFRGGEDPHDLGWKVMTLQFSPAPPPSPEIDLISPGRRVGRSFTAVAIITNPETADRVIWRINGKPRLMDTNGAERISKRFRGKKQKKRRGSRKRIRTKRVGVAVAVYESGSSFESDSDSRIARSKFYKFR